MNNKNILLWFFVLMVLGTAYIQYINSQPQKKETISRTISLKQIVTIDGVKKQSIQKVKMGTTALQLLITTHKVVSQGGKENTYVMEIDGKGASITNKEFWAFYINGKQAQVGAGSYFIKNNDTIEWKIESY